MHEKPFQPSGHTHPDASRAPQRARGSTGGHRSAQDRLEAARSGPRQRVLRAAAVAESGDDGQAQERCGADPATVSEHGGLELVALLSEGGGTRTWRARERSTREEFTVTFSVARDPRLRAAHEQRFTDIVAAWADTPHPHLVPVRATLGEQDRATALVTDHVRAETLAARSAARGRIAPEELAPVLAAVARGLAQLHELGWAHGALSAEHVLLTPDGRVLLDGHGAPFGNAGPPAPWGHARGKGDASGRGEAEAGPTADAAGGGDAAPSTQTSSTATATGAVHDGAVLGAPSAASDVHALGVLGWRALTGRHPGPDSHRVPLSLLCPHVPRNLVLMLESALCDDPGSRPSAQELAAGFGTPVPRARPARRPEERMTPEVIRADGTRLRPRGRWGPLPRGTSPRARPRAGSAASREGLLGPATSAALAPRTVGAPRRSWMLLLGVLAAGGVVWAVVTSSGAGGQVAGEAPHVTSPAPSGDGPPESRPPTAAPSQRTSPAPRGATAPATPQTSGEAPGATMQDKDEEARQAVRDLVSARAAALAAGDDSAIGAVYVPDSSLAARDREVIRRAAAQDPTGSGYTALSGLSMEVVRLEEQKPGPGSGLSPAEAARARTFHAVVATRGWHGELPRDSAVTRVGDEARQSLQISVVQTSRGWRLMDVTPVPPG